MRSCFNGWRWCLKVLAFIAKQIKVLNGTWLTKMFFKLTEFPSEQFTAFKNRENRKRRKMLLTSWGIMLYLVHNFLNICAYIGAAGKFGVDWQHRISGTLVLSHMFKRIKVACCRTRRWMQTSIGWSIRFMLFKADYLYNCGVNMLLTAYKCNWMQLIYI